MEILKNAETFNILHKTDNVVSTIANAARTCYQSQELSGHINDTKLIANLIKRGHHAMLEFAHMIVQFNNISRGFTHEMVRHRLCSFAQESTRYVDESDFKCVVPPHKDENETIELDLAPFDAITLREWFQLNEEMYRGLRKAGWKPEDARQVLPIGIKSQIVVSANLREWRHIFHMRCDKFAHWEIRGVMLRLLIKCKTEIPLIFDDFIFYDGDTKSPISLVSFNDFFTGKTISQKIYARNY